MAETGHEDRIRWLEEQLSLEKAKVSERELTYDAAAQEFEFQQSRWDEELQACHEQIELLQEQLRQGQQVAWGSDTPLSRTALMSLLREGTLEGFCGRMHMPVDVLLKHASLNLHATEFYMDSCLHTQACYKCYCLFPPSSKKRTEGHSQGFNYGGPQGPILACNFHACAHGWGPGLWDRLQLQTAELEAALKDVDTHKQLELQRTQYEQTARFQEAKIKYLEEELEGKSKACCFTLVFMCVRHASEAEGKLVDVEAHYSRQVSQYESLVEEATRAREEAAKDAAEIRRQMADIANDLQESERIRGAAEAKGEEESERIRGAAEAKGEEVRAALERIQARLRQQLTQMQETASQAVSSGDMGALAVLLANATGSPLPVPAGPSTPATPVPHGPASAMATARTPYTGGSLPPLTPSAFMAGMPGDKTASELYTMYSRVMEAWHQERTQVRKLEAFIEQIALEVENKSSAMARLSAERGALEETNTQLQDLIDQGNSEKQVLEQRLAQTRSEIERCQREGNALQQTIFDQSQQVSHMLDEVHRLQGKPIARDGPGIAHATADQLLTSSGVISSRLVTFRSLTELVEQNRSWRITSAERQTSPLDFLLSSLDFELEEHQRLVADLTSAAGRSAEYIKQLQQQLQHQTHQQQQQLQHATISGSPVSPR
ncbi:hypothetical protein DUNSADRAFT_3340 [Dunaliella salina]|uniref:NUA/TPR/MLP1-2-like domain-containing protein n=1 Tax=Dunaliella salina TaxID=3046 RepID=A0ABQ7GUF9_DUNSA|nr:hypothetical protein DUNSADRAFT_3340 [Dunaliella salina]|eukprot:KAF5838145.1 hypothetical protein DUNSADRAFT_3340 [Dunaliella salina]